MKPIILNEGRFLGSSQAFGIETREGFATIVIDNFDWIAGAREQYEAMRRFHGECLYVE